MNQFFRLNINLISKINFFLICLLPVSLVAGSLIGNSIVIIICLLFLIDIFLKKFNILE